jgi:hypothetical protein
MIVQDVAVALGARLAVGKFGFALGRRVRVLDELTLDLDLLARVERGQVDATPLWSTRGKGCELA